MRVLERETTTLPIEIYLKQQRLQQIGRAKTLPVQKLIQSACSNINLPKRGGQDIRANNMTLDLANFVEICGEDYSKKR